jgi:ACS family pantothenate transporter-like MFS transporter
VHRRRESPANLPSPSALVLVADWSQEGAGPLILSWINEICATDTEKRALLVAAGNDLAYVVQAVVSRLVTTLTSLLDSRYARYCIMEPGVLIWSQAPNFVWKTTDFPAATKGWTWVLVLNSLLSECRSHVCPNAS